MHIIPSSNWELRTSTKVFYSVLMWPPLTRLISRGLIFPVSTRTLPSLTLRTISVHFWTTRSGHLTLQILLKPTRISSLSRSPRTHSIMPFQLTLPKYMAGLTLIMCLNFFGMKQIIGSHPLKLTRFQASSNGKESQNTSTSGISALLS